MRGWGAKHIANTDQNGRWTCQNEANTCKYHAKNNRLFFQTVADTRRMAPGKKCKNKTNHMKKTKPILHIFLWGYNGFWWDKCWFRGYFSGVWIEFIMRETDCKHQLKTGEFHITYVCALNFEHFWDNDPNTETQKQTTPNLNPLQRTTRIKFGEYTSWPVEN